VLRINLNSQDRRVRQISLATLKWRDRQDKPTTQIVDEMVVDLETSNNDILRRLQLRSFAYSLLDDKDLGGYRRGTNHEPFAAPVRTCAEIFYTLSGFVAALEQAKEPTGRYANLYWRRILRSKLMGDEHDGKLDVLRERFKAEHPDLVDEVKV